MGIGIWRTGSGILFSAATYARTAGISAILGPAAVGGYRAIETVFAPTSLVGPALTNPGLPQMRGALERNIADAWSLTLKISALSLGLVVVYIVPVAIARDLVFSILGSDFKQYEYLILPIAVLQLVTSSSTGFSILLLAGRKMRETALAVAVNAILTLVLAVGLASLSGLEAAAWGIVLGNIPSLLLVVFYGRRVLTHRGPDRESHGREAFEGAS